MLPCLRQNSLLISVTLLLLSINGCGGASDSPEVKLERARILMERDQPAEAVPLLNEIITAAPKNAEAHYQRGVAYESLDVLEKALVDYTECLAFEKDRTDALNNKAVVLAKMKRFEEAAAEFTRLVNLDPQGSLAYRNRGLCNADMEQYEAALADYAKALELAPKDPSNWFQRAGVYLKTKRFEEAEQDYSKAIELDPELAKAWMNRGVAWYKRGDRKKAAEDLKKAQSLDDNIVLPDINFFADESASITSGTAVASGTPAGNGRDPWVTAKADAEKELTARGFSDLKLLREFPSLQCAEFAGRLDGIPWKLLVTVCADGQDSVNLPFAASSSTSPRPRTYALLILRTSKDPTTPATSVFQMPWSPESTTPEPVVVRYPLTEVSPK